MTPVKRRLSPLSEKYGAWALDRVQGRHHVDIVSVAFLVRNFRGVFAAFSSRAELRMLRGIFPLLVLCALAFATRLGANVGTSFATLGTAGPLESARTMGEPLRGDLVEAALAADTIVGLVAPMTGAGFKHLGAWLEPSEESEEKEPRSDSSAEELQQLALLSDPFHPVQALGSHNRWRGASDTEPHHEWIARLERPPCVHAVVPFI